MVYGPAMTYGNKRVFTNPRTGKPILAERKGPHGVNVRTWQDALRTSMLAAEVPAAFRGVHPAESPNHRGLLVGPVSLVLTIYRARPKSHYKRDGTLSKHGRDTPYPTGKPDADKVARCVADCGTGIWYADDAQVVRLAVNKVWAMTVGECTVVEVEPVA